MPNVQFFFRSWELSTSSWSTRLYKSTLLAISVHPSSKHNAKIILSSSDEPAWLSSLIVPDIQDDPQQIRQTESKEPHHHRLGSGACAVSNLVEAIQANNSDSRSGEFETTFIVLIHTIYHLEDEMKVQFDRPLKKYLFQRSRLRQTTKQPWQVLLNTCVLYFPELCSSSFSSPPVYDLWSPSFFRVHLASSLPFFSFTQGLTSICFISIILFANNIICFEPKDISNIRHNVYLKDYQHSSSTFRKCVG